MKQIGKWLRGTLEEAAKPHDPLGGHKPRMMAHFDTPGAAKRKPKRQRRAKRKWWEL